MRDIAKLQELADRTTVRVSFSITTNREDIRKLYEPLCAPIPERIQTIRALGAAGIGAALRSGIPAIRRRIKPAPL